MRQYFNPRSPHGERLGKRLDPDGRGRFQSTLPAWGATWHAGKNGTLALFQSTLPAWGATRGSQCSRGNHAHFNPRSPHGERPTLFNFFSFQFNFNPRSPHGERRVCVLHALSSFPYFNPRSPHGERPSRARLI